MSAARWGLGGVGVLVGLYGAVLLLQRQSIGDVAWVVGWLAGGVVAHDVVISAIALLAGALVVRRVPLPARAPVAVGAIVLGTVTVAAVPVLLALGRDPDNDTLLDRSYHAGWLVLAALVAVVVAVAAVVRARRRPPT